MSLDVVPLLSSRCSFPIERNDICFPFSMMDRSFMNEFVWGGALFMTLKRLQLLLTKILFYCLNGLNNFLLVRNIRQNLVYLYAEK